MENLAALFTPTHSSQILQCLYKNGKSNTQKIASCTGLTPKQVSRRTHELVKVGCIQVSSNHGCKRVFEAL